MSDNPKTSESDQENEASGELPIPTLETSSGDSSTSGQVDTAAIAKAVLEQLGPEIDRRVQSTKDKRIAAIENKLNSGQFADLEALGVEIPSEVKWQYRLNELEEKVNKQPAKSQNISSGGSGDQLTAQDVSQVLTDFGLDSNQPDVIEVLRGTYKDRYHFEATMARLALNKANGVNPSPSAAPVGNPPTSQTNLPNTELIAKMDHALRFGTQEEVDAAKNALKEAGVEGWDF